MSPFSNKMPAPAFSLRYFRLNGNKYFPKILMCICDKTTLHTGWRTKCHTIDCARNTFLLLQKHLTSGTELILIGWKIVPNEEHVQCDHCFASQPLANVFKRL